MAPSNPDLQENLLLALDETEPSLACVMTFNASDPSGTSGLTADITAIASAGGHALAVVTGAYVRDTVEIFDHFAFDEEAVAEQARAVLEDIPVDAIKVGFVGSPENISVIAEMASDYPDVPLIAYMPNLSWWHEAQIDSYLDAFRELMLPQTTLLVGNYSSLRRWLLADWPGEKNPGPKDIAKAAAEFGVPYVLVTGIALPDQFIDNVLATPLAVLHSAKFERFEAVFSGAGETLSAALTALLANGQDLPEATAEALGFLDQSLNAGFKPGMGLVVPDRMFWAQAEDPDDEVDAQDASASPDADRLDGDAARLEDKRAAESRSLFSNPTKPFFDLPPHGTTKH
jgi:hydroxymethylpyrimidine/phosphomethylpyrimidine kinase